MTCILKLDIAFANQFLERRTEEHAVVDPKFSSSLDALL
jgi:hypothetical protein